MYETEDALIAGMIKGEDAAFRSAIKQYQVSMIDLARNLVGEKIADEVVQEAAGGVRDRQLQAELGDGQRLVPGRRVRAVADEAGRGVGPGADPAVDAGHGAVSKALLGAEGVAGVNAEPEPQSYSTSQI